MGEDNVIPLGNVTRLDLPVDVVLENAKDKLKGVVIIGIDKDNVVYTATTYADGGNVMWLLKACEKRLVETI